jgi:hypothetical protein
MRLLELDGSRDVLPVIKKPCWGVRGVRTEKGD